MINVLIQLLVVLIVLVVIFFYIVKIAASNFGIPSPIVQIIGLILGLVFLLYALAAFGVTGPGLRWHT